MNNLNDQEKLIVITLGEIESIYKSLCDEIYRRWMNSKAVEQEDRENLYIRLKMTEALFENIVSDIKKRCKVEKEEDDDLEEEYDFA